MWLLHVSFYKQTDRKEAVYPNPHLHDAGQDGGLRGHAEEGGAVLYFLRGVRLWIKEQKGTLSSVFEPLVRYQPECSLTPKIISLPVIALAPSPFCEK